MSRPYHGNGRRRPRKRLRFRGGGLAPRSGYQAYGLKAVYDLLLPHVQGRARRRFFNDVSVGMALLFGVIGAGLSFGGDWLGRNRFYRR